MLARSAMEMGYTAALFGTCGGMDLNVLVRVNADLDGTFRAYCLDECEFITVNGWHFVWTAMNEDGEDLAEAA